MLISAFYTKVNKVIMAVLMISISHRCNSPRASLRDSFSGESLSAMPTKMGDLTNLSPNLHHVQKIMQMNWLLIWKTQRLGDINQRKNMQTKVTVIPILVHKWCSCDPPHSRSLYPATVAADLSRKWKFYTSWNYLLSLYLILAGRHETGGGL